MKDSKHKDYIALHVSRLLDSIDKKPTTNTVNFAQIAYSKIGDSFVDSVNVEDIASLPTVSKLTNQQITKLIASGKRFKIGRFSYWNNSSTNCNLDKFEI